MTAPTERESDEHGEKVHRSGVEAPTSWWEPIKSPQVGKRAASGWGIVWRAFLALPLAWAIGVPLEFASLFFVPEPPQGGAGMGTGLAIFMVLADLAVVPLGLLGVPVYVAAARRLLTHGRFGLLVRVLLGVGLAFLMLVPVALVYVLYGVGPSHLRLVEVLWSLYVAFHEAIVFGIPFSMVFSVLVLRRRVVGISGADAGTAAAAAALAAAAVVGEAWLFWTVTTRLSFS